MTLVTSVDIQNFKCYRKKISFLLTQGNFFIGANNAGKSAVLKALHCFFDEKYFQISFLNNTEVKARREGANRSSISVTFNIDALSGKVLKGKLKKKYGHQFILTKSFTVKEATKNISIEYSIGRIKFNSFDSLPSEVTELLSKISVSYIHPQEADELLKKAQHKLKSRLLSNWGRNVAIKDTLILLQQQWSDLRDKATLYLSNGLTANLQNIWPGCSTKVDLPEKVEDVIGVSEIIFKGSSELPEVSLSHQGTGAQSTILYQTHFLLDSDKTLHKGYHYPIWLIEEPESFLHADIIFKLGHLLCSNTWLNSIQMLISTHSPLLLAPSRQNVDRISWFLISGHDIKKSDLVELWNDEDIKEIGVLMGDPNFDIYFQIGHNNDMVFIEDSKEITFQKYISAGINVSHKLSGIEEVKRHFDVLRSVNLNKSRKTFFIIDNDEGAKSFGRFIKSTSPDRITHLDFKRYEFDNNIFLILLPKNWSIEDMFTEFDETLEDCASEIFNSTYTGANTGKIPSNLTRAHSHIRNKSVKGLEQAKGLIKNSQDIKDIFWKRVEEDDLEFSIDCSEQLLSLIE